MNPLEQAIAAALRANKYQKSLQAKIGTSDHPRGIIAMAYRNARRAMLTALNERNPRFAVSEVLYELQTTIDSEIKKLLNEAAQSGNNMAIEQLSYYDIDIINLPILLNRVNQSADAILSIVTSQSTAITATLISGNTEMILGDEGRLGILRPTEPLVNSAFWLSAVYWAYFFDIIKTRIPKERKMQKQAIAAIDNRTTDCCLRVHGQIANLDEPFMLTGTPRYADEMDWSPFHAWCRTSIALYQEQFDIGLTDGMVDAAELVLDERSKGIYKERAPADAYG